MLAVIALVLALSAGVRLVGLDNCSGYVFDEHYYVHDALAILHGQSGPLGSAAWASGGERSLAHPELGKLFIAAGIALFGNDPWGWRLPSVVAGVGLLGLVYPLGRLLGLSRQWAAVALVLCASDTMLIVQSRVGMLDIFVAFWSALCIYLALRYVRTGGGSLGLLGIGVVGGLALATKWSGALAVAAALFVLAFGPTCLRQPGTPKRCVLRAAAIVVGASLGTYVATYAAYFAAGHSLGDWLALQRQMLAFNWGVQSVDSSASAPATWIFDAGPIWYRWALSNHGVVGLLSIGNPVLWWAATACLVVLGVQAALRRTGEVALPVGLVGILYLPWLATSRVTYIYYMTPVVPFLALVLATALQRLVGSRYRVGKGALVSYAAGFIAGGSVYLVLWGGAFVWRAASGASPGTSVTFAAGGALALAAVALRARSQMPRSLLPVATFSLVGLVTGVALALLPFIVALPVPFAYYHRLMLFTTWR